MPRSELSAASSLQNHRSKPYTRPAGSTAPRYSTTPAQHTRIKSESNNNCYFGEAEAEAENTSDMVPSSSPPVHSQSTRSSMSLSVSPSLSPSAESQFSEYTIKKGKNGKPYNNDDNDSESDFEPESEFESDRPKKKSKSNAPRQKNHPSGSRSNTASPHKNQNKIKAKAVSSPKARPSGNGKGSISGNGSGNGKSWSAEEDWILFQSLHPKIKPDWQGIARQIGNGRDPKSCQNRYAIISKRLEGAIKSIGGA
ncbi:uncharacterized protein I303_101683 [Kwoniella dejecticola CBS 10117]|uniref:Myb-like domain-containing protein n=1 Tax=Kwoniella dejecticola CBS 10117 TaxID=1296121 RepID=A0A1A6AD32_9TREE|nr:uncharacterized protein I303_02181 [Kwoniella dejecticola CBS 10117]OBR87965.1 hypothetical protein I303_02181 [Kwoniella dejecticola CBS 10117]